MKKRSSFGIVLFLSLILVWGASWAVGQKSQLLGPLKMLP